MHIRQNNGDILQYNRRTIYYSNTEIYWSGPCDAMIYIALNYDLDRK